MTNDPRLIKLPKGNLPEAWAHRKPWTSKLDSELKKDWQSGMELLPILKKYGRTPIAVFTRLRQLGELSEELNPVELCKAMNSNDETGLWDLTKELATGLWDISKEVGKEAPGVIKAVAKEAREGIKSYSENAKVEAQKHHLEHFEKMKNFEKRAKDAGISDESLARFIKELGIKQNKFEEPGGSGGLLEGINHNLGMVNESMIEYRFEQYIKHFKNYKKIYKEAVVRGVLPDRVEEILKDCGFTLSELEGSADEESVKDASTSGEDLAKLKKSFGVTQRKLENLAGEGSSQKNFDQAEKYSKKGNEWEALANLNKDFGATPSKKITEFLEEHKANHKRSSQEDFNQAEEYSKKGNEKESDSKPMLSSYFSSLIEKYLSNYQAIERGEILQGNVWPTKGYHNHFRAVCRGEKQAVTVHEQAYMAWKKQDRPPQKGSTETTINVDLP